MRKSMNLILSRTLMSKKVIINVIFLFASILFFGISSPTYALIIHTPEVIGFVVDEKTKEPVENAWVVAQWEIITLSLQGDVHSVPWQFTAWTDKEGRFKIPSKTKIALLSKLSRLSIHAHASYGRYAWIVLEKFNDKKLQMILMSPKAVETRMGLMSEADVFNERLGSASSLCFGDRYGVGPKKRLGASDQQKCENFLLSENLFFLEKYIDNKEIIKKYGSITYRALAAIYKGRGEYKKALEALQKAKIHSNNYQMEQIANEIKEVRKFLEKELRGGGNAK